MSLTHFEEHINSVPLLTIRRRRWTATAVFSHHISVFYVLHNSSAFTHLVMASFISNKLVTLSFLKRQKNCGVPEFELEWPLGSAQ